MPWMLLATGYDRAALERAVEDCLVPERLSAQGASDLVLGQYALHHSADREEVARAKALLVLKAPGRKR